VAQQTPQAAHPAAVEVKELHTREQLADALAGDLTLAPIERDGFEARLQRAFALPERDQRRGLA
jgi:hypothetical protein